jgi:hypothetical protein
MDLADKNHFNIYPNPAGNKAYINLSDNFHGGKYLIKIFSAEGLLVNEIISENSGSEIKLDISKLKSGLYVVRIADDKKSWQSKLLIKNW